MHNEFTSLPCAQFYILPAGVQTAPPYTRTCAASALLNFPGTVVLHSPDRGATWEVLKTGDGRPLPAQLKAEIGRELDRLELVMAQIKSCEETRDAALASAPCAAPASADQASQSVPCVPPHL